jgi:hypothetical protein
MSEKKARRDAISLCENGATEARKAMPPMQGEASDSCTKNPIYSEARNTWNVLPVQQLEADDMFAVLQQLNKNYR